MDAFDKIVALGEKKYGLKIAYKDKSLLMKLIGKILFFNPRFMTNYITTIGSTVYFPSEQSAGRDRVSSAAVLAHELVHISDSKEVSTFVFSYTYLFPQVIALLSVLAIFSSKLWLLCLLFLLPVPSPMRAYWELRGYAMSDAVNFKLTKSFLSMDFVSKQFLTSAYYFMWPFKQDIEKRIELNRSLIASGKLSKKLDCEEILKCFD